MSITGQQRQIFNQARLLNILEGTYGSLPEEREAVDSIRGGICYMLSIEWLLRLLEEPLHIRIPYTIQITEAPAVSGV